MGCCPYYGGRGAVKGAEVSSLFSYFKELVKADVRVWIGCDVAV